MGEGTKEQGLYLDHIQTIGISLHISLSNIHNQPTTILNRLSSTPS